MKTSNGIQTPGSALPMVASVCGTFLKPEMQSVYRQVAGLRQFRTTVLAEQRINEAQFPFEPLVLMEKQARPRLKGNFILRCWYKHITRQWPPPRPINKEVAPYYPYNLPRLLADLQPALVHVYYGHKAVKYRSMIKAWGGPWVVSFHGVDVAKFLDNPAHVAEMAMVFAEAELVLGRSQSLLDRLAALGCPPGKLRLNPTPIPLDGFPFVERDTPPDGAYRLVQASRLIGKKGLFTTLKALPPVLAEFPNAKFVLCGDGPAREKFTSAVAQAGLGGSVEMLGWLDQDALKAEYLKAQVFLHPSELTSSEDQEGVPNSMLEAMATGLPVVATRHGGIPEAVTHGANGLLVEEGDANGLAAAVLGLLADPARLGLLGQNAASTVAAEFSQPAALAALEETYRAIAASSS